MTKSTRIHRLDNRLANQIAAGEVVERPASVAKELLENAIDSGATKIEIDAERGGMRLLRVTDNGSGIHKDDLTLALTRHATSKIQTTEDLAAIITLGFRGEALASIASVSRLTLTSRPHDSELAWQAVAQGREMAVEILPAAAAPGTRVEVAELFYNTPARQKFMRTEKTEFAHLEEVFKQHALANHGVAFVLKHNHKVVKRVPAVDDPSQRLKRIATICGKRFADNAIEINCQHEIMRISGFLGTPSYHRSESDIQYVFVNGRPVKDKMLNHAIRKSYQDRIPPGRMPTYVLFLEMDPASIDVNVHPTKHEVRFDQQRFVHDLLAKSICDELDSLNDSQSLLSFEEKPIESLAEREFDLVQKTHIEASASLGTEHLIENKGSNEPLKKSSNPKFSYDGLNEQAYRGSSNSTPLAQKVNKSTVREIAQNFSAKSSAPELGAVSVQESVTDWPLIRITDDLWICQFKEQALAFQVFSIVRCFLMLSLKEKLEIQQKKFLFPLKMNLSQKVIEDFDSHQFYEQLGFDIRIENESQVSVLKVPAWMANVPSATLEKFIPRWGEVRVENNGGNDWLINMMLDDLNPFLASFESKELSEICRVSISALSYNKQNRALMSDVFKPITAELFESLFEDKVALV